ncbi:MAG: hypothetical protein ACR5LF_05855 [Symbiopectobacterium sp.]
MPARREKGFRSGVPPSNHERAPLLSHPEDVSVPLPTSPQTNSGGSQQIQGMDVHVEHIALCLLQCEQVLLHDRGNRL